MRETRQVLAGIALFAYVLWFRTHGVSEGFWLRGDQIRHWAVALRDFTDLPLSGVPSVAGGTTLGPTYYWFLWLVARVLGPVFDYLPHAGGIGIAALQSVADAVLFVALCRRLSIVLSAAIVLGAATSGYDATLSSTIWNPPFATACAKFAMAALVWNRELTLARSVLAVVASWLAVQAHMSGLLIAIPVIAWVVAVPFVARQWRQAASRAALIVAIVAVLQVPWMLGPASTEENRISRSVAAVLDSPAGTVHLVTSAAFVARSLHFTLIGPFDEDQAVLWPFGLLLAAATLATAWLSSGNVGEAFRQNGPLAVVSAGPILTAVVVFSLWQETLDQVYWCLLLVPPASVGLLAWIDRAPPRTRKAFALIALALVLLVQPARANMAWTFHRMPSYGDLVRGCRSGRVPSSVGLPTDVDVAWLCSVMKRADGP